MTLVTWNQNLLFNVKSVDEHHKMLVDILNDFYDNITKRTNQENISKLIYSIKTCIIENFSKEENLMKTFDYPYYSVHKKEHDLFTAKFLGIENKFDSGQLVLSLEVTSFLFDWLKNHVQETDKKYSEFLLEQGVN
jgi:hemerythrin